jgi:L-alanine-DL-glutamate epimerase-like enolase superfamily enzyme
VEIFHDRQRDPLWHEIQRTRPVIQGGYMHLNDQPGLGLDLDPDVIAHYRADW